MAASMITLASCEKDNSDDNAATDNSVADTEWSWRVDDLDNATGMIDISVEFNGPKLASLIYTDISTGVMQTDVLIGTYSYSGGRGTLTLDDDYNNTTVNASFTISGTTMTLVFKGITYTLTKQ